MTAVASGSSGFSGRMTDTAIETVTVPDEAAGGRLDRVLAAHLGQLSRSRLKALILAGQVTVAGRDVKLTPKEFDVLTYLATYAGKVVTRRALLQAVWGSESTEQSN